MVWRRGASRNATPDRRQDLCGAEKTLNDPDVKEHFNKIAMITAPSASPDEYARFVHAESINGRRS